MYYDEKVIETTQCGDFTITVKEQTEDYSVTPIKTRLYYELFFNKPELLEKLIKDREYYYDKFMYALDYSCTVDPETESEDARFLERLEKVSWRKMTIIDDLLALDMCILGDMKTSKVLKVEYCPENNPERYHEYTWEEDDDFDNDFIIEDVDDEDDDFEIEGYDDIEIEVYDEE